MRKEKINSRNTKNPYELILGVELTSKSNKNMKVSVIGEIFDRKGKKNHITVKRFRVIDCMRSNKGSDYLVQKLFKRIGKFAKMCKNKDEIITVFLDTYKANKELLNIKFTPIPAYTDALDAKYIRQSLIDYQ